MNKRLAAIAAYLRLPLIGSGAAVSVLLAVILLWLVIWQNQPEREKRATAEAELAALRIDYRHNIDRLANRGRYLDQAAMLASLDARLVAPVDRSGVVSRLTALSNNAGTRIIHGASTFGKNKLDVQPVLQELTVEGSYSAIRAFLVGISRFDTLTLLRNLELTAENDGTRIRAQMRFVTLAGGEQKL